MLYYPEKQVITKIRIRDNSIVYYPSFELFDTYRGKNALSLENLTNSRVKGFLSPTSARKVQDMVLNWTNTVKAVAVREKTKLDQLISFITLTLPAKQYHCDRTIKRSCLNVFLIQLKRRFGVTCFLWKAEPQKNGNLHFHILVNKWIRWQEIRKIWNAILDPLGYINEFEAKHKHRDPNSTDIHGLYEDKTGKGITYLGAYLAKYIAKRGEGESLNARPICGRVWGCSDSLKNLKSFTEIDDSSFQFLWDRLNNSREVQTYSGEFFKIFMGNWHKMIQDKPDFIKKVDDFYYSQKIFII